MLAPILTDMFNHWFAQGAISGSVTEGEITLIKKGSRHVWEELDDYWPITLLNTELKILARVLANRLPLVISDLIEPEQNYAVKGRLIQDNLHLIREILEGLEDGTEAKLINLDQSKAFDRVDHRLLVTVLETAEFQPEFCKWISMMYLDPQAMVQVNAFVIEWSVRQGCPRLLFSMSSHWSPCSVGLETRRHVCPCAVFLLLVLFRQGYPRRPMISLSLCPTVWTLKLWRRRLQGPKSILIRAKVCGWVPGRVAFPHQSLSAGVTDPSASSRLQLERNWS